MFRIIVSSGKSRTARNKRQSAVPSQAKGWLRQLGIMATSVLFLPIAIFSLAVFIVLFLAVVAATLTYGFWLRSRLQGEKPRQVIDAGSEAHLSNPAGTHRDRRQ